MQAYSFSFTMDASGSPDAITLAHDFPIGARIIVLKPPTGHAWTFYGSGASGIPLDIDATVRLERGPGQTPFCPGETIGCGALDTGSGTGYGLAS